MENNVTVLFATQTGTAEELAERSVEELKTAGFEAEAVNLCDYSVDQLREAGTVLVVAATWGEGEPPDDCVDFTEAFTEASDLDLSQQRYAVLALGDTAYDEFCGYGKILDDAFEKHGATRLKAREDCDLDQDERFPAWIGSVIEALKAAPASA
ncbi:MAG: flavodoxin domain-containing protein [Verrucomicrobiota bacterium]